MVFRFIFGCAFALACVGCAKSRDNALAPSGYSESFSKPALGPEWRSTGSNVYTIVEGELRVQGAHNHPLWLDKTLPHNVRIEFDTRSMSQAGDIKVELCGDGKSFAKTESYTASGYVVILGGWGNALNVIARMNEHGSDRVIGKTLKVEPGRTYHMVIERREAAVTMWVDGVALATMQDKDPLVGPGHRFFAFNNWDSEVFFDNLVIKPL